MKTLQLDRINSPIGTILIVLDGTQLCSLDYEDYEQRMRHCFSAATDRSLSYQPGTHTASVTSSMRISPATIVAWTLFQSTRVAQPFNNRSGSPYARFHQAQLRPTANWPQSWSSTSAYRAVGGTNALNPIAIVVPCHRVVGANTSLTGYAGGLERKQWLLQHEGVPGRGVKNGQP